MRNLTKYGVIIAAMFFATDALAQQEVNVFMIARNLGEKVIASGDTIRVFGFAEDLSSQPNVPGPTIIANEGDSVHIDLWNVSQGAPHTIHLHGLDVDQQNDGVPHLSFDIPHMEHGYYHFKAPHAGTYLYHCHVASSIHVQAGMYGLVIIKEANGNKKTWTNGFDFDREFAFLNSEIDTSWHTDSVLNHHYDHNNPLLKITIPKYEPQFFLTNGFSDQQLKENNVKVLAEKNEKALLRLANIGFYGVTYYFPSAVNATVISSDGRPLPNAEQSNSLTIFPGERYEVLLQSDVIMQDSIAIDYFSLNTLKLANRQFIALEFAETLTTERNSAQFKPEVYPNPSNGTIHLKFCSEQREQLSYSMIDNRGREVYSSSCIVFPGENVLEIDVQIPAGVYFLLIRSAGGAMYQKVVYTGNL